MNASNSDVATCSALTVHSEHEENPNCVPPPITHDFSYPSDEEIVPNPKVDFSKGLFLKLEKYTIGSRGPEIKDMGLCHHRRRLFVFQLLLRLQKGKYHPMCMPTWSLNSCKTQPSTQRPSASTHLKKIASKKMEGTSAHVGGEPEDVETDGESSSSLLEHTSSHCYSDLALSLASEDESEDYSINIAPTNVATDQTQNSSNPQDPQNKQVPPGATNDLSKKTLDDPPYGMPLSFLATDTSASGTKDSQLEERLRVQQDQINKLTSKFDQLFDLLTGAGRRISQSLLRPMLIHK
jgi:hypothetical protein